MITLITATDMNGGIGCNNKLPWNIPEEMKIFIEHTREKIVIMGRKTFDSLGRKPLPNRSNVVLTKDESLFTSAVNSSLAFSSINTVDTLIAMAENDVEYMVIGGSEIYSMFMPYASRIIRSTIRGEYECDSFFPTMYHPPTETIDYSPWRIKVIADTEQFITHDCSRTIHFRN